MAAFGPLYWVQKGGSAHGKGSLSAWAHSVPHCREMRGQQRGADEAWPWSGVALWNTAPQGKPTPDSWTQGYYTGLNRLLWKYFLFRSWVYGKPVCTYRVVRQKTNTYRKMGREANENFTLLAWHASAKTSRITQKLEGPVFNSYHVFWVYSKLNLDALEWDFSYFCSFLAFRLENQYLGLSFRL